LPFTLAHPAAVLPLRRTKLVFSALIVGSMAPDYPYFYLLRDGIRWSHSWSGVFFFCLPAGVAMLWLFHAVLKRPLVALAPEYVRARISEDGLVFRFGPPGRFLLILGSLLLGTLTHILWDGITHEHGLFAKHWAWLSTPVMLHHVVPLWKALQFLCSAAGLIILLAAAVWWWRRKPAVTSAVQATIASRLRWLIVGFAAVIAAVAGTAARFHELYAGQPLTWHWILVNWRAATTEGSIVTVAVAFAEWLLFSLAWHLVQLQSKREKPVESRVQRMDAPAER
jgi:hypothetical protein